MGGASLNFFQIPSHRFCSVRGTRGTVEWSLDSQQTRLSTSAKGGWETLHPLLNADAPADMFLEELRHFLDCVASGTKPCVTGEDGREALRIVLAARRSADEHHEILTQ
jgi:predicted dehydrogenase